METLPHENALFNSAELAEVIGADLETIKNWVRRGIISRTPLGGRQMPNRLFSADEVYKTAVKYELVKLGLAPSSATDAVNSIWKQYNRNDFPWKKEVYAVLFPTDDKWTTVLCSQFTRQASPRGKKKPLPDRAFAVVPISDTLTRIGKQLGGLIEKSKKTV